MAITKAASLADDLVCRLEQQIESGAMPPGSRFPTEKAITQDFGVSRTVVREAFARLAAQGLLVSRRGSGAYVPEDVKYRAFQVTAEELSEIDDLLKLFEMRIGFETEMAALAAERRTDADLAEIRLTLAAMDASTNVDASVIADAAFHAAIARATGNDYFVRFSQFLGVRMVPSRRLYLHADDPDSHQRYARRINLDHEAIYEAIESRDTKAARTAARRHLRNSIRRYEEMKEANILERLS